MVVFDAIPDEHTSDNGDIISKDCNLCHTILAQGTQVICNRLAYNESLEFEASRRY